MNAPTLNTLFVESTNLLEKIRVVDSHTGGEPTRVIVSSSIKLQGATMAERAQFFQANYDHYRRAVCCEPRGSDIMVGALLCEPVSAGSTAGVIFFNNVGNLGMCGHGLMGLAVVLNHLGLAKLGRNFVDTPVGTVCFELMDEHRVSIENVSSYRWKRQQPLTIFPESSQQKVVHGDIAWGGNWFFICHDHGLSINLDCLDELNSLSHEIRRQLDRQGITGAQQQVIDHIELVGEASRADRADAKNFVLCPGGAYDRSPCGTGTSAKIACLAAEGLLLPGQVHRQESIVGSIFSAQFQWDCDSGYNSSRLDTQSASILPTLSGFAYVNGEAELLLNDQDPFCWGLIAP